MQHSLQLMSAAVGFRSLPQETPTIRAGQRRLLSSPSFGTILFWIAEKLTYCTTVSERPNVSDMYRIKFPSSLTDKMAPFSISVNNDPLGMADSARKNLGTPYGILSILGF